LATRRVVAQIGAVDNLVIFAGSGVTFDRVGFGWRGLVIELLKSLDVPPEATEILSSSHFSEPQLASIAAALYDRDGHGDSQLRMHVHQRIYGYNNWREGTFAPAVADLAIALRQAGKNVTIVTTNFDQFIEEALTRALAFKGLGGQVASSVLHYEAESEDGPWLAVPVDNLDQEYGFNVVHLHGLVPNGEGTDPLGSIVLSEADYFKSEDLVDLYLEYLLSDRNLLIVGSGLDDAPLLRALALTEQTRSEGTVRWAVFPKVSMMSVLPARRGEESLSNWESPAALELLRSWKLRMRQFGVTLVTPDFFSQASQFLREIEVEIRRVTHAIDYGHPGAKHTHTERLTEWHDRWRERVWGTEPDVPELVLNPSASFLEAQADDHFALLSGVRKIKEMLSDTARLKMEIWLRFEPGQTSRSLQLWASSNGPQVEDSPMKVAAIEHGSSNVAIQVFCSGMPEVVQTASTNWPEFLGVPVTFDGVHGKVTVGVVTLGVQLEADLLDKHQSVLLGKLLLELREIGEKIVKV
jgi:hypothetical protein